MAGFWDSFAQQAPRSMETAASRFMQSQAQDKARQDAREYEAEKSEKLRKERLLQSAYSTALQTGDWRNVEDLGNELGINPNALRESSIRMQTTELGEKPFSSIEDFMGANSTYDSEAIERARGGIASRLGIDRQVASDKMGKKRATAEALAYGRGRDELVDERYDDNLKRQTKRQGVLDDRYNKGQDKERIEKFLRLGTPEAIAEIKKIDPEYFGSDAVYGSAVEVAQLAKQVRELQLENNKKKPISLTQQMAIARSLPEMQTALEMVKEEATKSQDFDQLAMLDKLEQSIYSGIRELKIPTDTQQGSGSSSDADVEINKVREEELGEEELGATKKSIASTVLAPKTQPKMRTGKYTHQEVGGPVSAIIDGLEDADTNRKASGREAGISRLVSLIERAKAQGDTERVKLLTKQLDSIYDKSINSIFGE